MTCGRVRCFRANNHCVCFNKRYINVKTEINKANNRICMNVIQCITFWIIEAFSLINIFYVYYFFKLLFRK